MLVDELNLGLTVRELLSLHNKIQGGHTGSVAWQKLIIQHLTQRQSLKYKLTYCYCTVGNDSCIVEEEQKIWRKAWVEVFFFLMQDLFKRIYLSVIIIILLVIFK